MTGATTGTVPGLPARYRIAEKLAETAHSDVYLALDDVLGRQVAIKVLGSRAGAAQRAAFVESGRLAAGLRDPRVVLVHDAADPLDGRAWTAMQYHPRGSVADEIRRSGPLPVDRVLQMAEVVADVLRGLHRDRHVVHRDIKPSNVLVHADGSVALADFGVADRGAPPGSAAAPPPNAHYAPPEVDERGPHDVPGEIYALGATLVEALCGTNPFARADGETEGAYTRRRAAAGLPDALRARDLPQPLLALLDRMLAVDPAQRPATWDDVLATLRAQAPHDSDPHAVLPTLPAPAGAAGTGPTAGAGSATTAAGAASTDPAVSGKGATGNGARAYAAPEMATRAPRRRRPLLATAAALAVIAALGLGWMVTTASRATPIAALPAAPTGQSAPTTPSSGPTTPTASTITSATTAAAGTEAGAARAAPAVRTRRVTRAPSPTTPTARPAAARPAGPAARPAGPAARPAGPAARPAGPAAVTATVAKPRPAGGAAPKTKPPRTTTAKARPSAGTVLGGTVLGGTQAPSALRGRRSPSASAPTPTPTSTHH